MTQNGSSKKKFGEEGTQEKYEGEGNFNVIINVDKGDLEIWKNREVVENGNVENAH